MNPEFRQTLNTLSHNFESANQAAQENIYTFTQLYIDPCLAGFKSCLQDCTAPCFPNREDSMRRRRARGRSRGRAENFFDFYDDWDEDEMINSGMVWGNDELDSLLAGRGAQPRQPQRQRTMSYGSRGRARGDIMSSEAEQDPTIIRASSYLGILESLPWRIGQRVLRYKPSAANLQENPGGLRMADAEVQPLLEEDEDVTDRTKGHTRQRSGTQNSRSSATNSLSSRGDLILSEEEEDALEIDEEFAITLGRRTTNTTGVTSEDQSSGKKSARRTPGLSRRSTRTTSSKSQRSPSQKSLASQPVSPSVEDVEAQQSMQELREEETQAEQTEELEIAQKREAAQRLAESKGLSSPDPKTATTEIKAHPDEGTEPFPSMIEVRSPRPMSPEPTPIHPLSDESTSGVLQPQSEDGSTQDPP